MAACSSASNKRSVSADFETQRSEIAKLMKKKLAEGDIWYLVDTRWWQKWKKFVGYQESDQFGVGEELNDPGPIDNSNLFATDGCTLKGHLIDELDYNFLPEEAWFKLASWYGVTSDHQTIPRKVVEYGMFVKSFEVEVYLMKFRLGWKSDPETLVTRQFSKGDTIGHIISEMRKIFSIPSDVETRVWAKYMSNTYELLSYVGYNVRDAGFYNQQILLIEQKNEDGTWGKPRSPHSSSLTVIQSGDVKKTPASIQKNPNRRKRKFKSPPRPPAEFSVLTSKETIVDQLRNTLGEEQQMKTLSEERLLTEMLSSQARQQDLQRRLEEECQQKTVLEERLRNLELQMQEERNRNLSYERELQSAVSAGQQELQRKENANREQQRLLEEERQQKTALEERLRNLELQMQEERNRNLSYERELQSAVSAGQQELQRKKNSNREQQRLLEEERQQKTALEERLRNLELQMQEERNRNLSYERELQSAVSAAQQELQRKENANRERQRLLEEERQQKTALEERLRNLELQMQEERNRNLSYEMELQSAVSAAEARVAEYQLHPPHEWIIQREEVLLSDNVLGNGAWGSVRQGKFRGCQVAVKEIHELILSPHNRRLFEREMRIASCCRHPNLLQFIGATNDDGNPLFVTEILDTSLRRLLSQQALNHEEIVSLAFDIAKGLNYLHLHRPRPIIHRDISSANVLLWRRDEGWRAKLSDYGSANFMRQCMTVNPGAIIYSAPEALTSQQSPKLDVYSFGVLLCEMCIRELPDPDPQGIHNQIRQVTNGTLQKLIKRCVKINPEERPTISEVISQLEGHSRSKGILTRVRTSLKV